MTSNFELTGTYIYNYLSISEISESIQIARLKGLYMFNTKLSLSSFIQYNSEAKTMVANFRLRYNPQEGNDLYLVINDDLNTARGLESLRLPLSNQRTVLLKYTYTFRP